MIDRRLLVLSTFAATGTVTAAADVLGYSPSTVSAQLRDLQRELGITLLVPEGRGLRLSPAGARLVARSGDLIALWESMRAELGSDEPTAGAALRLGGFSTASTSILVPVAARLEREHPHLSVRLVEADPQRCFDLLTADRLDAAVVLALQATPGSEDPRFEQFTLRDDPLDVILPARHPLARRESVELAELTDEPWISDRPGTPYRSLFVAAFTAAGATPEVVHEVVEWDTAAAIVEAGLGVGLVPRLARVTEAYDVARVPVAGPAAPHRRVVVVIRRGGRHAELVDRAVTMMQEHA